MALLLLKVCVVFYALVAGVGLVQLIWSRPVSDRTVLLGLVLSVGAHAVAIGLRAAELAAFPVLGLSDGLSFFGFVAALIAIRIGWKGSVPQAPVFASLLGAAVVAVAALVYAPGNGPERIQSPWLPVHIAFAFLGLAVFAVAAIVAGVYLVQDGRLRQKRVSKSGTGARKLPALDVLDQTSLRLYQAGFPLMGIGLLCGAIYSEQSTGQYWNWNVLNTLGVLVWVMFATILYFRMTIGWRGRKAAFLTLTGVLATLGALFALSLSGWGPHGLGT